MAQRKVFEQTYESSLDTSRVASEELSKYWSEVGISPGLATQLELCVVEMVNNTFIHAYNEAKGKEVTIRCSVNADQQENTLSLEVEDHGEAMSQQELTQALSNEFVEADPFDEETWTTSGRGFLIVSSLMDSVELQLIDGINRFVMKKALATNELVDGALLP